MRASDIRQVPDVPSIVRAQDPARVLVGLRFDEGDPPTGALVSALGEVPFVGWLGLLRGLSDLLAAAGLGRQLGSADKPELGEHV